MVGIALREVNPNRKICNFFGHYTLYTKSGEIQVILQQIQRYALCVPDAYQR